MKTKLKMIFSIACLALSLVCLLGFGLYFASFLISTMETNPSFGEAVKNILMFIASAIGSFGALCMGVVFAYVAALLGEGKLKKAGKAVLVLQLVLLFFFLVVLVSMNIMLPEGTI